MATWYWAATAPANFATANWATTSGGTASGTPAATDSVVFDGTSSQTCTIAAATTVVSLDCNAGSVNGPFTGTLSHLNFIVTVTGTGAGALRFSLGMIYSPASINAVFTFNNTTTALTANLTSAGKNFGQIIINNTASGVTQQQDNLNVTAPASGGQIVLTQGTFDASNGGANYTTTCNVFSSSNANVRRFIQGGNLIVGGAALINNTTILAFGTTTNLTWTVGTGNIVINAPTSPVAGIAMLMPPSTICTFNAITLNNTSIQQNLSVAAAFACASVTIGYGWSWQSSVNTTIGVLTINGTSVNPCGFLTSSPTGAPIATLTSASTATWCAIQNMIVSGATATATNSFGLGVTTGWTITPPASLTAATIATAVWTDLLAGSDFAAANSVGAMAAVLANMVLNSPKGTVGASSTATSVTTSAINFGATASNQLVGRNVMFNGNTATASLQGAVSAITAVTSGSTPTFTVSPALPAAPASGDVFMVI